MNRIKQLRTSLDMKQADLASQLKVGQNTISNWENGKTDPDSASIQKMATMFGCSIDYILGHSPLMSVLPSGALRIPVLGDVAAGIPIEAITDIVYYEEIDAAMASSGEFFGLRIKGSSMEPRIREGDVVIVRKQDDADNGDIVIVLVNGNDATVKKLKKEPSGITLIPFNPAHDTQHYSREDIASLPVRIIGKVVELRAKF